MQRLPVIWHRVLLPRRRMGVVEGPDGALHLMTSNRDGRGDPARGDDRILRVVPPGG